MLGVRASWGRALARRCWLSPMPPRRCFCNNTGTPGDDCDFAFSQLATEYGPTSGEPLPLWQCAKPDNIPSLLAEGEVRTGVGSGAAVELVDLSDRVPGAFQLLNVLTLDECRRMIEATERMGYHTDAPVSLPHSFRHMENVNWIPHPNIEEGIFNRVRAHLPEYAAHVAGAPALGINARFRCYRYAAGDYFRPHTDGSWPGSRAIDGELRVDAFGDRWSQFTFLILLSDEYEGGSTVFHGCSAPPSDGGEAEVVRVRTPVGAALCFPHGGHPLHCLHAGEEVTAGLKYMVRTEILYERTPEAEALQAGCM